MADATQKNRDALKQAATKIIPSSSPLGQSLQEDERIKQEQLLADEANNLVMQRPEIPLPQEAQAFTEPVKQQSQAASVATQTFNEPLQQEAQRLPATQGQVTPQISQPTGLTNQTPDINNVFNNQELAVNQIQEQEKELQKQKLEAIDGQLKLDDADVKKAEPSGFFAGKNTWQKILGGVGMFLGSLTPEGARNVSLMIDKEIERDLDIQKTNIKLGLDKKDKDYQRLLARYGSQEAALLARKRDIYTATGLHLQKLQMNAQGEEARAKLGIGLQELEIKRQQAGTDIAKLLLSQQKEESKFLIPGYKGAPLDQASKRDFQNTLANADTIRSSLGSLEEIIKDGGSAIPFTQKSDRATQLVGDIQLQLKEIKKLGVLSGDDAKRLDFYISNPSIFKSDKRMIGDINGVRDLVGKAVSAMETAFGQEKDVPFGAKEIK